MKKNRLIKEDPNRGVFSTQNLRGNTVGLGLGDRWSRYSVLDSNGEVIEEDRIRTTAAGVEARFAAISATRIVIEAGTHSPWVSRQLTGYGHEVVVANARKVRLIYESDRKNDRMDARMLARLGRLDATLLAPVRHRSAEAQANLAAIRSRDALVAARTTDQRGARYGESDGRSATEEYDGCVCKQNSECDSAASVSCSGTAGEKHLHSERADPPV